MRKSSGVGDMIGDGRCNIRHGQMDVMGLPAFIWVLDGLCLFSFFLCLFCSIFRSIFLLLLRVGRERWAGNCQRRAYWLLASFRNKELWKSWYNNLWANWKTSHNVYFELEHISKIENWYIHCNEARFYFLENCLIVNFSTNSDTLKSSHNHRLSEVAASWILRVSLALFSINIVQNFGHVQSKSIIYRPGIYNLQTRTVTFPDQEKLIEKVDDIKILIYKC